MEIESCDNGEVLKLREYVMELEEKLKETEYNYKSLIEFLPDVIFLSKKNKILFTNNKGIELIGAKNKDEIIGRDVLEFIHPDYRCEVMEGINDIITKGDECNLKEQMLIKLDGSFLDVEMKSILLPINKENIGVTIVRDITERKRVEEVLKESEAEKEINKLKTEFFANISHELRTPLNVILGSQQLLALYLKNHEILKMNSEKVDKHLAILKQNCNRLLRIINNLIDITRIDSGFFELNLGNYNIVNIVEEITLSVAEYIESKGIELIFDTEIEEKIISCDPDKIERIILNLLSNAIKFTRDRDKINVNIYDKNNIVLISVKDTGVGIPDDKLNVIFDRFRQVDSSFTRKREGSGIGLSLVKSLVEMHEGNISVKSEYGKGSEFIIELPAKKLKGVFIEKNKDINIGQEKVERIKIEFSDIYSI